MKIGIIGGSGLYEMEEIQDVGFKEVTTPFGLPSDMYVTGKLGPHDVCFLPRHGRGHRFLPSEINHRANIFGFKTLGVERIVSVSAVGSLKHELRPRDVVLPDQYFDRTRDAREHSFFGHGIVAHISFAEPSCPELREIVASAARDVINTTSPETRVNQGGTYVNITGPAFSTRAESSVYRKLGFDVIGMTSLPEAKLCREAEICYQSLAMVTDYDCWHETEKPVTVEILIEHLNANTLTARKILAALIPKLEEARNCACKDALRNAILTRTESIPDETRKALSPIISRHL